MYRTEKEWIQAYKDKNALWIHNGNPKQPHALLAGEEHSSGFFNSRLVITDQKLLDEAASDLLELFQKSGGSLEDVDGVVGPQTGATVLAGLLRNRICEKTKKFCYSASPEKCERDGKKAMNLSQAEKVLVKNSSVLLCEDVCTTGGSVELAAQEVKTYQGRLLPFMLVLVNRSGLQEINGRKVIALINHHMPKWKPNDCPLCKGGSEALRAKDNWDKLNAV